MSPLMRVGGDGAQLALQRFRIHGFDEMPRESGELGLLAIFGETVAGQRDQAQTAPQFGRVRMRRASS